MDEKKLVCYGCCHSIADVEYPSGPSGERPCFFCIRNPKREQWAQAAKKNMTSKQWNDPSNFFSGVWYDNRKSIKSPMDCYHSLDMLYQIEKWIEAAKVQGVKNSKSDN